MKDKLKEQLIELFQEQDWQEKLPNFYSSMATDVIWALVDLVREGKYLEEPMIAAEILANDPNPSIEAEVNQQLLKGEDVRYIATVRGSLSWLLDAIISRLDTSYYKRVVDLVEKLAKDDVHYVRLQATYPLAGLMLNVRAEKNKDGSEFKFSKEDKKRVIDLFFYMLKNNRAYPRVLEGLTNVFDKMRFLSEYDAMQGLLSLLYDDKKEFYPEYVTDNVAPLLIFFAEFINDYKSDFKTTDFQALLETVIKNGPARLKSSIIWHMWKSLETNPKLWVRFKKYFPILFTGDFQQEPLSQYEFLIDRIMAESPKDGIALFKQEIEYVNKGLNKVKPVLGGRIWFHAAEDSVEKVSELEPESLLGILDTLKNITLKNGYIGDVGRIFSSYEKAPVDLREGLKEKIIPMYQQVLIAFPMLPKLFS